MRRSEDETRLAVRVEGGEIAVIGGEPGMPRSRSWPERGDAGLAPDVAPGRRVQPGRGGRRQYHDHRSGG